jgi:hypothetical protein
MTSRLSAFALTTVLVASSAPAFAAPPSKEECIDANAQGQNLRREGKFSSARQALRACADSACPAVLRTDCVKRLDELDAAQPTLVLEVKDSTGVDVAQVVVKIDGNEVEASRRGAALPLDPGQHTFVFEAPGRTSVSRTFVVTEGERGRRERVVLESTEVVRPAPRPAPPMAEVKARPPRREEESTGLGARRTIALAMGGVGIAGLAAGTVFGVLAMGKKDAQVEACASSAVCTPAGHEEALSAHTSAQTFGAISTTGFVLGGLLVAAGATLFFTAPSETSRASGARAGWFVAPAVSGNGGAMTMLGRF